MATRSVPRSRYVYRARSCIRCGIVFQPQGPTMKHCSLRCRFLSIQDRFEGQDGCWEWPLSRQHWRYGIFKGDGPGMKLAHRIAWEVNKGPIPAGLFVLHDCDNPPCIRHHHLFLGTHQDNVDDMMSKGRFNREPDRWPHLEEHPQAKLTVSAVHYIRSCDLSLAALAKIYGVSISAIHMARHRLTWKSC